MHPERTAELCRALADKVVAKLGEGALDLVVSPAMGGVVVGYEMGRQLGVPAIFTERVEGEFELRRGFELDPGVRVLMAEDVVTTGKSSRECIAAIGAATWDELLAPEADAPVAAPSAADLDHRAVDEHGE